MMLVVLEWFAALLETLLLVLAFALLPATIIFIFGFVRGQDYEVNTRCELCECGYEYRKALSEEERAYANLGRIVCESWKSKVKMDGGTNDGHEQG